jgi:hypothetical protein
VNDFLTDINADISISGRDFVPVSGVDAIRQHMEIRLRTFLGEWFLDTTVGVPYIQEVFSTKIPDTDLIRSIIRREVIKTPGVLSADTLGVSLDTATRNLTIELDATTTDGNVTISLEVGI